MDENGFRAAVAAGTLGSDEQHRALLQSIVDVARAIFDAKASSIFLYDEDAGELVFEAVSGEGEDNLIGMRLPANKGIAGSAVLRYKMARNPVVRLSEIFGQVFLKHLLKGLFHGEGNS